MIDFETLVAVQYHGDNGLELPRHQPLQYLVEISGCQAEPPRFPFLVNCRCSSGNWQWHHPSNNACITRPAFNSIGRFSGSRISVCGSTPKA
jgi:hypothetical protein